MTNQNIINHTKNYKQYQDYIHKKNNETKNFIQNNIKSDDKINFDKRKAINIPSTNNRNIKPIFKVNSKNDIVEDKYSKIYKTLISLDSADRDLVNIYMQQLYLNLTKNLIIFLK